MQRYFFPCLIAFFCLLTVRGEAQDQEHGFLNIANMVPGEAACDISIGGKELVPGGLKAVSSTGWFIVPKGDHNLSLGIEGYKSASGSIKIEANASVLYVVFLQQIGAPKDLDGKVNPPQVRIRRCEAFPNTKGHYLQAMSFCQELESFQIGPHKLNMELFGTQEIASWNGGTFNVLRGEKTIGSCPGAQEKGSYILLIGSNHKRTYATLLVRNDKQELPPWMKKNN